MAAPQIAPDATFRRSPAQDRRLGFWRGSTETVTFRQLSAEAQTYRDAVEFRNGMRVRLQELEDGQRLEVLTLSSEKADVEVALMTDAFGSARL